VIDATNLENDSEARILIVDDHPILRQGLADLINMQSDMVVCADVEDGHAAITALPSAKPQLAVIDISLPGMDGIELIKRLRKQDERCLILVLSMHDESIYAERVLGAGARGYIMKQEVRGNILSAIRKILDGGIWLSDAMTTQILSRIDTSRDVSSTSPISSLSNRELEVLTLIGEGKGPKDIAVELSISIRTVDAHRAHIKKKLNLKDARSLFQYAIEWLRNETSARQPPTLHSR
jgi:DNA-binding NarL/FixJ family response regulator